MVYIGEVQCLRDLHELAVFRFGQPPTLDLAIQYLTTQFDRGRMLFNAEPLANLVTRPPGSDVRQPVPARLCRR